MITDASIRAALRSAPTSGKSSIELKDDGARGEGRLALIIRVAKQRVSSEWYAVWYSGPRRHMAKLGAYPTTSLGDARKMFTADYAPAISRGEMPKGPRARRARAGVTVKDLFQAYVNHLRAAGKASAGNVELILLTGGNPAAKGIGETVRACDVVPDDIIPHLEKIHATGAITSASQHRSYLAAAFNFGMASENSYTTKGGAAWGIKVNPVTAIPADPDAVRVGNRHLTPAEFRAFWRWLEERDETSIVAPALRLVMLTGQRVTEILKLTVSHYDKPADMLDWGKTKNGQPHNIPLAPQGVSIMGILVPNRAGLYFPHRNDAAKPVTVQAPEELINRYLEKHPDVAHFTPRDLRRTWKTLAGAAGLSKDIRDRLQNHARSDVSSRHYDRYEMLPERRAAVKVWAEYVDRILAGAIDTDVAQLPAAAGA